MVTSLQKDILIDYANNNWYTNIYYYYINQESLVIGYLCYVIIKKQAQYY